MIELLAEAARIGAELPVDTAREIAESANVPLCLQRVGPANRRELLLSLFRRWHGLPDRSFGIALLTSSLAQHDRRLKESVELVWTGPDSHLIPVRQTEQVVLEMIRSSREDILVVSYAVYRIPKIKDALVDAIQRGVRARIVVDIADPAEITGYNPLLAIGSQLMACAQIFYWPTEQRIPDAEGKRGSLHVKCVVSDTKRMFVSSANLTEQAFRLNMELGILITGTEHARDVGEHFSELIAKGVLKPLWTAYQ